MYRPRVNDTLNFYTTMEVLGCIAVTETNLPNRPIEAHGSVTESILYSYINDPTSMPTITRSGQTVPPLKLHNFTLDTVILTRDGLPSYESTANLLK